MIDAQQIFNLVGAVVMCELLIELFHEATPLAWLRRLLRIEDEHGYPLACGDDETGKGCAWYSLLAGCGYCMSVWVGVACGFAFGLRLFEASWMPWAVACLLNGLVVHRLSNAWHAVVGRLIDTEGRLRRGLEMMGEMESPSAAQDDAPPDPGAPRLRLVDDAEPAEPEGD